MACRIESIQTKVNRLISKNNGKPRLKPNKPLVLKDEVNNRKPKKAEASCLTEMSIMMACWKQHNFDDSLCSKELNVFNSCVNRAQETQKNALKKTKVATFSPQEVKTLLHRFPNQTKEI